MFKLILMLKYKLLLYWYKESKILSDKLDKFPSKKKKKKKKKKKFKKKKK